MSFLKDRMSSILKKCEKIEYTPEQIFQINNRISNSIRQSILLQNKKEQESIEIASKTILNK